MSGWVGCWLMVAALAGDKPQALERFDFTQQHMGVPVKILLYAPDKKVANDAAQAAYARIAQLDGILSDYNPDSELRRLCRRAGTSTGTPVSNDLWNVLWRSQQAAEATEGAFDVTVGPLVRLWRRARREKELPTAERLADARAAMGHQALMLDAERRTVALLKPKMRIDLGGIGMGYAVDEAMTVLGQHGVSRALIDASGDIMASDPPPGKSGWTVGIAPLEADRAPSRLLLLAQGAVSTSGDAFQFVEINGRRYSHIVDPQTGLGLGETSSVTVVAPDCITADWLSTAVSVMGPERGLPLIDATDGCAALIVRTEQPRQQVQTYQSKRLGELNWVSPPLRADQ